MLLSKLPTEVRWTILHELGAQDRLHLAVANKELYEKVRNVSVQDIFRITTNDTLKKVGTFFLTQICRVTHIILESTNYYNDLKELLCAFQLLLEVHIPGPKVPKSTARQFVRCLPYQPTHIPLNLIVTDVECYQHFKDICSSSLSPSNMLIR
jgi:hypothetical protein